MPRRNENSLHNAKRGTNGDFIFLVSKLRAGNCDLRAFGLPAPIPNHSYPLLEVIPLTVSMPQVGSYFLLVIDRRKIENCGVVAALGPEMIHYRRL